MSIPLPLTIIVKQMGADEADLWRIKAWTDAFFKRISMMLTEEEEIECVLMEIEAQHYFQPIFERLRDHTRRHPLIGSREQGNTRMGPDINR